MHGFRMIRSSNELVPGRFRFSVGISGSHIDYSVNPGKIFFQSPKTTACQIYIFHLHRLIFPGNHFRHCRFFSHCRLILFCFRQVTEPIRGQKQKTSYTYDNPFHISSLRKSRHLFLQPVGGNVPGNYFLHVS